MNIAISYYFCRGNWQLFRMIWHMHHTARPRLLHVLASIETRKKVVKIGSAGEMRGFLCKYGS